MMSDERRFVSRNDPWADVSASHLGPTERRKATESKEKIMLQQKGRTMVRAPYEKGETEIGSYVINTLSGLNAFLDKAHDIAEMLPTVICLETKGTSNHWVKARKEIDGEKYMKNDESSGVTVIMLNILIRDSDNLVAFIDARTIIDEELGGKPNFPERFFLLLRHRHVMVTGESAVKHIKRIENSFFERTDKILYLSLHDLTRRWRYHKSEYRKPWDFYIDPYENDGLLLNFHEVFHNKTFFKNPYEVLSDWSDVSEMRDSQVKHAINKSWFTGVLVEKILQYFYNWNLSLSVMGTLYPKCKEEWRLDFKRKDYNDFDIKPPHWYQEDNKWPCCPVERWGECSREANLGRDPDQVRLDQEEEDKRQRSLNVPSLNRKRKIYMSDVSDAEDADQVMQLQMRASCRRIQRTTKSTSC